MQRGRPKEITDETKKLVIAKRKEGSTIKEISNLLSVPLTTVWMILNEVNMSGTQKNKTNTKAKDIDLSSLPDNVLFKHINHPIP